MDIHIKKNAFIHYIYIYILYIHTYTLYIYIAAHIFPRNQCPSMQTTSLPKTAWTESKQ